MRELTPSRFKLAVTADSSDILVRHRAEQLEASYDLLLQHSKEFARSVVEAEVLLDSTDEEVQRDRNVVTTTLGRLNEAKNEVAIYKTRVESLLGHVPAGAEQYADNLSRLSRGLGVMEDRFSVIQNTLSERGLLNV